MFNRRDILKIGAAAATGSLVPDGSLAQSASSLVEAAKAAGQNRVVIAMGAGTYEQLNQELFFQPFTQETGIEVVTVGGPYSERFARLKAMNESKTMEWDIMGLPYDSAQGTEFDPYVEDLGSCGELPNVNSEGVGGSCLGTGVLWDSGGSVLTFDERAFPDGGPTNWAEFWDVERFPGPRSLPNYGSPWYVIMAALLADGVARDKLFPLDLDRAFAKLDKLRPNIGAWWTSGDQSQQLLRTQEVVASMLWNGRAARLKAEGVPVKFSWDGAIFEAVVFGVTKGAPNATAAKALLNFMYSRPEAHARFAEKMFYALPSRNAAEFMDADFAATLVTAPDNWPKVAKVDAAWLNDNRAALMERWTAWISG